MLDELEQEAERVRMQKPTRHISTPIPIEMEKKRKENTLNAALITKIMRDIENGV